MRGGNTNLHKTVKFGNCSQKRPHVCVFGKDTPASRCRRELEILKICRWNESFWMLPKEQDAKVGGNLGIQIIKPQGRHLLLDGARVSFNHSGLDCLRQVLVAEKFQVQILQFSFQTGTLFKTASAPAAAFFQNMDILVCCQSFSCADTNPDLSLVANRRIG